MTRRDIHWALLDLEAGSIVWAFKRLRGYRWGINFRIFSDYTALNIKDKVANLDARVQRGLKFLTVFEYTFEYRQ